MGIRTNILDVDPEWPEPHVQAFRPGAIFPNMDEPQRGFTVLIGTGRDSDLVGFCGPVPELRAIVARITTALDLAEGYASLPPVPDDGEDWAIDSSGYGQGDAYIGDVPSGR